MRTLHRSGGSDSSPVAQTVIVLSDSGEGFIFDMSSWTCSTATLGLASAWFEGLVFKEGCCLSTEANTRAALEADMTATRQNIVLNLAWFRMKTTMAGLDKFVDGFTTSTPWSPISPKLYSVLAVWVVKPSISSCSLLSFVHLQLWKRSLGLRNHLGHHLNWRAILMGVAQYFLLITCYMTSNYNTMFKFYVHLSLNAHKFHACNNQFLIKMWNLILLCQHFQLMYLELRQPIFLMLIQLFLSHEPILS